MTAASGSSKARRGKPAASGRPAGPVPDVRSENELVLLGLVAEEPTHAYRVEEKIRERRMAEWTEIGFSSVYRLLSSLERRGLVRSRLEHEGQGATRKVHEVTPRGRQALTAGVLAQLGSLAPIRTQFQIGLAFVTHAPRGEVLALLSERTGHVERARARIEEARRELRGEAPRRSAGEPSGIAERRRLTARLLLDYLSSHLEVERDFAERARRLVAAAEAGVFGGRP